MGFTYVKDGSNAESGGSHSSLSATLTGVAAGSLITAFVKHEGAATNVSLSDGDAYINVLTGSAAAAQVTNHGNGDLHGGFFYILASGSGDRTVTALFASARPFPSIILFEHTYTDTLSLDVHKEGTGSSGSMSSGNFTTAGANLVLGGYCEYVGSNSSAHAINGVAADHVRHSPQNFTAAWDRIVASGFTGAATCTNPSSDWICNAIAFKTGAGGGEPLPMLVRSPNVLLRR